MSGDVTYGAIKRISYLPDNERPAEYDGGTIIGGQEYDNVYFVGGEISGVAISNVSLDNTNITNSTINSTTIGLTTPAAGSFTTLAASGQITSTVADGTPPFVVTSTTEVPNLYAYRAERADGVTVIDAAGDTTMWVSLFSNQTGTSLAAKTDTELTYNATTNTLSSTNFSGALTGNASTATALQTARLIGNVSFNGTADIVPQTIQVANDAADATCFVGFFNSATGSQQPKTNASLTFDATTANLGSSILTATTSLTTPTASVTGTGGLVLTGQASPTYAQGKLVYDTDNQSLTFFNNDSNVSLQIGQEMWIRVLNNTGVSIANGAAVQINGSSGGTPTVSLVQANAANICIGLATETIANGAVGYVTQSGLVRGLNTNAWTAGTVLYVDATTPGALTSTAPTSPNYRIRVGVVGVQNATTGTILVNNPTTALGFGTGNQLLAMNAGATAQTYTSTPTVTSLTIGSTSFSTFASTTFTPTIIGSTSAGTATYSIQQGAYTRINNMLFGRIALSWSAGTGTGNLRIAGLPATVATADGSCAIGYLNGVVSGAGNLLFARCVATTSQIWIETTSQTTGTSAGLAYDAAGDIALNFIYTA